MEGGNGLWLRYTWYFGRYTPADLQSLVQRLCREQIRYAYFHVRYIQKAGTLRFHYAEESRKLLTELRQDAPPVMAMAWIYAGNQRGSGHVDLANPAVRKAMVAEAVWLVTTCGFDGVQWDFEFPDSGDPGLSLLLQETRAALPPGKLLSAAVPMWLPPKLRKWGWSDEDFTRVAPWCDQVVVMCYDSGYHKAASYIDLIHQQMPHVTRAIGQGNRHCRVILGLPAYEKAPSHDPAAENIASAMKGLQQGLSDPLANPSLFNGVALFADYTARPADWKEYQELWLKRSVN